jgi:hypothetical protein
MSEMPAFRKVVPLRISADLYVPVSAVANVIGKTIHLHIRQAEVDQMGRALAGR